MNKVINCFDYIAMAFGLTTLFIVLVGNKQVPGSAFGGLPGYCGRTHGKDPTQRCKCCHQFCNFAIIAVGD